MSEWTREQRAAIETLDRPYALVAGAGSGKTSVLVERYRRLLSRGLNPREILTVTFTQDAAAQLKDRIRDRLLAEGGASARLIAQVEGTSAIGTIHSFCYGVLDTFGGLLNLPPIARILDPFTEALAFDREYDRWVEELPSAGRERLLGRFSRAELRRIGRSLWGHHREAQAPSLGEIARELRSWLLPLWNRLDDVLLAKGLYTFSDLETLTDRLMREAPEVVATLRGRYGALLVDEFQDTSPLQWRILGRLGEDRNVFLVGDPKQSIYGFRDADVEVFLQTARTLETSGGEVGELTLNFRSPPDLLADVNRLAAPLFAGGAVPFSPMASGRQSSPGDRCRVLRHDGDEPAAVARSVQARLEQGAAPESIALLFRVSDRISRFREALGYLGIPASFRQSHDLFSSYGALDLAHALEALADPFDDFALGALLRSSFVGMTPAELAEIQARREPTLFEKLSARGAPSTSTWVALLESAPPTVGAALDGLFARARRMPIRPEGAMALAGALLPASGSLFEAVERLRRWRHDDLRIIREETGGVRLLTVHGAKGLEFDHVWLVDTLRLSPRVPPVVRRRESEFGLRWKETGEAVEEPLYGELAEAARAREKEEAKRILYVALTRARETLTLSLPAAGTKVPKGTWAEWLGA